MRLKKALTKIGIDALSSPQVYHMAKDNQRVVCAAVRLRSGVIVCGPRHFDMTMRKNIEALRLTVRGAEQGFVDQWGNFLTRVDAFLIAHQNGQIRPSTNPDAHDGGAQLYSEDLY